MMASGKRNYFRHSMTAFEDEKIQNAISLLGYEGYAYYFILLELLARNYNEKNQNVVRIHQQSLRNVWRKQSKSCKKVVEKLQQSGLFVATFKESFVEFDVPNLSKYLGRYKENSPQKAPNKIKLNEIKLNKIKEKKELKEKIKPEVFEVLNFEQVLELVSEDVLKKWSDLYPDHAWLKSEIEDAILWNREKGELRTKTGWTLFLNNWLKRSVPKNQQAKSQPKTFAQIQSERNSQAIFEAFSQELFDEAK